jgi:hypothetical protein
VIKTKLSFLYDKFINNNILFRQTDSNFLSVGFCSHLIGHV